MKRNLLSLAILTLAAGSAFAFGNTTNSNNTTNQGGAGGQGGAASVESSVRSDNRNTNTNLNSNSASAGAVSGSVSGAVSGSGGNTLTVEAAENFRTAATAYAAPLAASNGTCMGSTSAGAQGTFGLSFGTTWVDAGCDARYDAEALAARGLAKAAQARLCMKPEIAEAMELAGTPCKVAKAATPAPVAGYTGNDPIVRARLAAK